MYFGGDLTDNSAKKEALASIVLHRQWIWSHQRSTYYSILKIFDRVDFVFLSAVWHWYGKKLQCVGRSALFKHTS